jgi:hypothetical protein
MLRQYFVMISIGFLCVAAPARAQSTDSGPQPQSGRESGLRVLHYSSTAGEGWLRGEADWMRGFGDSARSQGEAAYFNELAVEKHLQNRQQRAEQYWNLRSLNQASRQAQTSKSQSAPIGMPRKATPRPQRCTTEQLALTGKISWPCALQCETCCDARERLEAIFARRAAGECTSVGTPEYRVARAAIAEILVDLRARVREVPTGEYIAAKKLLTSLEYEAGQSPQPPLYSQN